MDDRYIKSLFKRYQEGTCTEDELRILHQWIQEGRFQAPEISDEEILEALKSIETNLPVVKTKIKPFPFTRYIGYAASIISILALTYYFYSPTSYETGGKEDTYEYVDLKPGKNQAFVETESGSFMIVEDLNPGELIEIDGGKFKLNDLGQLEVHATVSDEIKKNKIVTPNGGQYEVILSDGTHVWLNAGSELSFYNNWDNENERRVSLKGEAYFDVARNEEKPFLVSVKNQKIQVLGTEFNVNAYPENDYVKTSLIEGKVLFNEYSLKPGQSALYNYDKTVVFEDRVDDMAAWKNGYFVFFEETLEEAMTKISRWYDLELEFVDENVKTVLVGGSVSKFENAREVFNMMEKAGDIKISNEGKKVFINSNK